jgi:hypothetical protein
MRGWQQDGNLFSDFWLAIATPVVQATSWDFSGGGKKEGLL